MSPLHLIVYLVAVASASTVIPVAGTRRRGRRGRLGLFMAGRRAEKDANVQLVLDDKGVLVGVLGYNCAGIICLIKAVVHADNQTEVGLVLEDWINTEPFRPSSGVV